MCISIEANLQSASLNGCLFTFTYETLHPWYYVFLLINIADFLDLSIFQGY